MNRDRMRTFLTRERERGHLGVVAGMTKIAEYKLHEFVLRGAGLDLVDEERLTRFIEGADQANRDMAPPDTPLESGTSTPSHA